MSDYYISEVSPSDRKAVKKIDELLHSEGIRLDDHLDYICAMYDELGEPIATGSCFGNTLRCFAVRSDHRGEALLNEIVTHLIEVQYNRGNSHLFLYTKPASALFFSYLGFHEIARVEGRLVFMENRPDGFSRYISQLQREADAFLKESPETAAGAGLPGAIVMNANPFTLGHQYLVRQAAAVCSVLHIFVLSEDASLFPADVRKRLVAEGVSDLPNVILHESGSYMISSSTFPGYFLKSREDVVRGQAELDLQLFCRIAHALGIESRFVGDEPFSETTAIYNDVMKEKLPQNGIACHIIPRLEQGGEAISASHVRELIQRGQMEKLGSILPPSTLQFLETPEGEKIITKIRNAGDVVHH